MADFSIIWIDTKSNLLTTPILLVSFLQYKSHVTEAIFTRKTKAIHFAPKCLKGVELSLFAWFLF